ncbi:hypothetical protein LTR70_009294 [Exophiala xenobiotica]|uniref:Uncharacterized protein n=1 Tax=Lithohypha guttulata TaxID=1690604 RepID=A0ABR0JY64_9EURO|nr:hypothetical protein LTR24_009033 [Lithohypha guttulata]KAK5310696.1 hypothetical protein LTR70_009294 [Exophiala xenobiotica]
MSEPTPPTTWFDLPKEVQDHVLRYVFAGKTIIMRPSRARYGHITKNGWILRVSKHFVSRRQVLDAIARHSRMVFTTSMALEHTLSILDSVQRSSVRSIDLDCGWTDLFINFHRVRAVFPRIEEVELSRYQMEDDLPTLYFDRKAKLFQALRSNHGDSCQDLGPDEEAEDESEYPCSLGCHDAVRTPTAYSIEYDFDAGHIEVEEAQALMQEEIIYWPAIPGRQFIADAMSFGIEVKFLLGMNLEPNDCRCRFLVRGSNSRTTFSTKNMCLRIKLESLNINGIGDIVIPQTFSKGFFDRAPTGIKSYG